MLRKDHIKRIARLVVSEIKKRAITNERVGQIKKDPEYLEWIEWGEPRPGHPEGKVKHHISELEKNLEKIKTKVSTEDYWKLQLLIHTHDTFKGKAKVIPSSEGHSRPVPIEDPESHASLAVKFVNKFHNDPDLNNILQYHDMPYSIFKRYKRDKEKGKEFDYKKLNELVDKIKDLELFLIFNIIDGSSESKDKESLKWWIDAANKHRPTRVTKDWIL